jgi:Tfp pilus assembly protein PilF
LESAGSGGKGSNAARSFSDATGGPSTNPVPLPPVQEKRIGAPDLNSKSEARAAMKVPNVSSGQRNDPEELDRRYRDGRQRLKDGDFAGAIQLFNGVIAIDPEFRKVYHERGYAHQLAHQPELAIQDYSRAIEIDPRDAVSYTDRAVCLAHMRQDDQAMADFSRALEIRPIWR